MTSSTPAGRFRFFWVSVIIEVPSRNGGGHVVGVVSPSANLDGIAGTSRRDIVHTGAVAAVTVPAFVNVFALVSLSSAVDSDVRADLVLARVVFSVGCAGDRTAKYPISQTRRGLMK
jgi:hypothetical protein